MTWPFSTTAQRTSHWWWFCICRYIKFKTSQTNNKRDYSCIWANWEQRRSHKRHRGLNFIIWIPPVCRHWAGKQVEYFMPNAHHDDCGKTTVLHCGRPACGQVWKTACTASMSIPANGNKCNFFFSDALLLFGLDLQLWCSFCGQEEYRYRKRRQIYLHFHDFAQNDRVSSNRFVRQLSSDLWRLKKALVAIADYMRIEWQMKISKRSDYPTRVRLPGTRYEQNR
jgi:hypothetical protein